MAAHRQEKLDPMDEVARMLALNLKRERGLSEVIVEMMGVGMGRSRVAELLGTTPAYVDVAMARAKKTAKRKAPKGKE